MLYFVLVLDGCCRPYRTIGSIDIKIFVQYMLVEGYPFIGAPELTL